MPHSAHTNTLSAPAAPHLGELHLLSLGLSCGPLGPAPSSDYVWAQCLALARYARRPQSPACAQRSPLTTNQACTWSGTLVGGHLALHTTQTVHGFVCLPSLDSNARHVLPVPAALILLEVTLNMRLFPVPFTTLAHISVAFSVHVQHLVAYICQLSVHSINVVISVIVSMFSTFHKCSVDQ